MGRLKLNSKHLPLVVTIGLFFLMFTIASIVFRGFFAMQVFLNLFIDNSYLLISAVGMTFVLVIGGIDISVGSVLALTCMLAAYLIETLHFNPFLVMFIIVAVGGVFGLMQGCLIHFFRMQPFIVTLGGLSIARGLTAVISIDTISITEETYAFLATYRIPIWGKSAISISVVLALIVLIIGMYIAHHTKFGRAVYAIGGNEQSARLMGLNIGRVKVMVYVLNGICSGLAGVAFSLYMRSGFTLHGIGMEMQVIAAAVIGGTLLSGGVGYVFGALFGALTQGIILTVISFQGTLSSWWTTIAIAILLFMFVVIQSLITARKEVKRIAK